ncbi:helix-turn-helix transcriptional regulator [Maribacter sp. X9]|uniref:helix-turn-helix transcriptional regulator n=1 Tax=Maribacter sp. X9 TaxID=3402159 RepID=UPI003AF371D6
MLDAVTFIKRLELLLEHYELSSAAFADRINVQRSSISHLLKGRNKPSLEFVMKINEAFSEVDLEWLLYGKGTFPNGAIENNTPEVKKRKLEPLSPPP